MHRSTVTAALLALAVGLGLLVAPARADAADGRPFMVAHRGGAAGAYVENTMRAFDHGAKSGAFLEADIRFTRDDVPVLMHDERIDRTTNGRGPVASLTFARLRRFKTADGQRVPSFATFTKYLRSSGKKAFVEFKRQPANDRQWRHLRRSAAPVRHSIVVYSWSPAHLKKARSHGFKTALYERRKSATPAQIAKAGSFYLRQYASVTKREIAALTRRKVRTILFTPATANGWRRSAELGAWGVLTDNAARYAAWRD